MTMRGGFKVRNVPPPGKKRIADWMGLRVAIKTEMTNGYATFPAGCTAVVAGVGNGLHLKFDPCNCCGIAGHLMRVHGSEVKVIDTESTGSTGSTGEPTL
jgi:hypothetical protein